MTHKTKTYEKALSKLFRWTAEKDGPDEHPERSAAKCAVAAMIQATLYGADPPLPLSPLMNAEHCEGPSKDGSLDPDTEANR